MEARLKRRYRSGTTLVELLTAMTIFLVMLGVIMAFYTNGASVTRRQDQRLEVLRRSLRILDRFDVLLSYSNVLCLTQSDDDTHPVIFFTALNKDKYLTAHGASWSTQASCICVDDKETPNNDGSKSAKIYYRSGEGKERIIGDLKPGESIELKYDGNTVSIKLSLLYYPNSSGGEGSTAETDFYVQTRTVPLYNHEEY